LSRISAIALMPLLLLVVIMSPVLMAYRAGVSILVLAPRSNRRATGKRRVSTWARRIWHSKKSLNYPRTKACTRQRVRLGGDMVVIVSSGTRDPIVTVHSLQGLRR
jgi:hypothetical protein